MEMTLSKIQRHGDDSSVLLSIEADYGWKGEMYRDNIQVTYNGKKREAFIASKIVNPGAGMIIERLYELIFESNYASRTVKNPPLHIIEQLAEKINLVYNDEEVRRVLA